MARISRAVAVAVCAGITAAAGAASIEVEGNAGIGRSDNIARTPDNERSATIRSVGVRFSALEQRRRLDADLIGDLSLLDYAGHLYPAEVIGSAAGRLRFGLIEDRLHWVVEDHFGQTRQDLFSAPSPANRENVNFFSTGPDLRLALGSANSLLLGGRYTRVDYEHGPADSERFGGWLALERMLSSTARASVNVSTERIEPRGAALTPAYDRSAAYARYALTGRRTSFSLDAGGNRVSGDGSGESGLLLRVELGRDVGGLSRLTLRAGHELTDSGASLGPSGEQLAMPSLETGSVIQTSQPYTSRYVGADWRITGRRTTLGFSATWSDEDYAGAGATDLRRVAFGASLERTLGARTSARLGVLHNRNDFKAAGGVTEDTTYSAALSWAAGRRLGVEVAGDYYGYSSELLADAHEVRYWLRLRYGNRISR